MRVVVREWERVLRYRDGRYVETLGPGAHRRPWWRTWQRRVEMRPRLLTVAGQELLTSDGMSVKVSLLAAVRVDDARRWHEATEDPDGFAYAGLQLALRDAVGSRSMEQLLAARADLGAELRAAAAGATDAVGLTLDSVAVRDVMVPAELRQAAAETAVARSRGLAALERARAEVAATRALANAARLVADNPALLQLRTLQAVERGGATVVLQQPPS